MQLALSPSVGRLACRRPLAASSSSRPCGGSRARPLAVVVRAEGGLGGLFGGGKDKGDKEDAARKALQDAFKGKKDPFAAAEERAKRRGGGGGGGGGDGGGGGGFNWREWGDGFRRGASDFFKAVATLLLIGAVMVAVSLWQPLMAFLGALVRAIFRLDAGERAQRARGPPPPQADLGNKEGLGNVEASVISKYAAAEEDDDEGGESGEDEV